MPLYFIEEDLRYGRWLQAADYELMFGIKRLLKRHAEFEEWCEVKKTYEPDPKPTKKPKKGK